MSDNNANDYAYKQMAALTREISERTPEASIEALDELVSKSLHYIPFVDYAGIAIVEHREHVATPAASHEYPRLLDTIQQKNRQGPNFAMLTAHDTCYISDLHTEQRWPSFCADAVQQTSIRSLASFPLFITRESVGVLNFYADTPDAFDQRVHDLGVILATHAAIVWGAIQRGEQFRYALEHRDIIGQAKGMIMERFALNAAEAFALLQKLSQDANVRVYEVARRLVDADHPTN
jgi:GAF domain-containing protein